MKKKQTASSFPYFFGSVILIVTAIAATSVLNRTTNTANSQDVRARASVTSLMRLTAVITSFDENEKVVVVNGLQFTGSTPKGLEDLARNTAGEWRVTVSGNVNLSNLNPGSRVELQVNPSSFNIAERTLTAAAITQTK
ncbi:hypothetical protein HY411_03070 [Candidatus Gottesmanbacteria bacterium]|nr:hypothetical protein [Candidatus Gottesmanbacteria bacterium]